MTTIEKPATTLQSVQVFGRKVSLHLASVIMRVFLMLGKWEISVSYAVKKPNNKDGKKNYMNCP